MKTFLANLSIRDKLFAAFVVTILFAVLSISLNLFTIIRTRALNVELQMTYAEARKYYRVQAMIEDLDLALQTYLYDGEEHWEPDLLNQSEQLAAYTDHLLAETKTGEEKTPLQTLKEALSAHTNYVEQIISAMDDEDDDEIDKLDEQASYEMESMYDQIDLINNITTGRLNQIDAQQNLFSMITFGVTAVSILAFILVCIVTIVTINRQINHPLDQLRKAVKSVQSGAFDPAALEKQAQRQDEIGRLTQAFIQTVSAVTEQEASLEREAADLRSQIIK